MGENTAHTDQVSGLGEGVTGCCKRNTRWEISAVARQLVLRASPMMDMKDVSESRQYRERGLFTPVRIGPDGREINAPARFAQFSNFTIETTRPAPSLSEHTAELLCSEVGISTTELQALFVHGVI